MSRRDRRIVARHEMPGMAHKKARPVRDGLIKSGHTQRSCAMNQTARRIMPSLRDGSVFFAFPGSKLPGYDHSVPTGQPHRQLSTKSEGRERSVWRVCWCVRSTHHQSPLTNHQSQSGSWTPASVGPEFATHRCIGDHEANGICDFFRLDQPFQLGLWEYFCSDVFFSKCSHHRSVGKSRMDHAAANSIIHRFRHERGSSSFQTCFGR